LLYDVPNECYLPVAGSTFGLSRTKSKLSARSTSAVPAGIRCYRQGGRDSSEKFTARGMT